MWHVRGRREVHTGYLGRNLKERDGLEDLGIDGRIILKMILRKWESVDWIGLVQDRDKWRAVVP
jgi:hypothetical protein